jgi:uncharacterized protein (DUF2164 family)
LPLGWKPASKDTTAAISSQISAFIEDENTKLFEFPADLSSGERAVVHKVAQSQGLQHYTVGLNDSRRVIIEKIE